MLIHLKLLLVSILSITESKLRAESKRQLKIGLSLSQCITAADIQYFSSDFETITFTLPSADVNRGISVRAEISELVLPMLEEKHALLIKDVTSLPRQEYGYIYTPKSYSYIIHIRQKGEFEQVVKRLRGLMSWNPHAKFLVTSLALFANPHSVAVEVIKSLWKYNVINAAVMLMDTKNTTNYLIYSWKPFSKHSCGNNFNTTRVIDSCSFGIIQNERPWFEQELFKQLYNCPVKVNYLKFPPFVTDLKGGSQVTNYKTNQGIEINLLNMIAHVLKIRLEYNLSAYKNWGQLHIDRSATNDLKHLMDNEIDIVIGGYSKTAARMLYLDCSLSYMQDSLKWCVPHKPLTFSFRSLVYVLKPEVWIFILLTYLIVTVFVWYFSCCSDDESTTYKNFVSCLQNHFSILIGFAVNILPRTSKTRYMMALFLILSLNLNALYTGYLTSVLSAPYYTEKYGTVENIYKYNLKTYFFPDSVVFFRQKSNLENDKNSIPIDLLLKRWRNCTSLPTCLDYVVIRKDSAVCMTLSYIQYLLNKLVDAREKMASVYCLKEEVVTFPVNAIMRKGFPLFNLFNRLIDRILSAGFIDKWERDNLKTKQEYIRDHTGVYKHVSIKFKNLVPVFQMLAIVYYVSALIFVAEHFLYRRSGY